MEQAFIKRGRLEIVREILATSRKPARKTRIIYKCNLNFNQLKKYLEHITSNNLLSNSQNNNGKTFYLTTEKGIRFLKEYERLNNLCPMEEEEELWSTGKKLYKRQ